MKKVNGFTLVEIVIVIAILGILAGLAIPYFTDSSAMARGSRVLSDLRTIDSACAIYTINNGSDPKDIDALVTSNLLAAKPIADVQTFIITKNNGKAVTYYPAELPLNEYRVVNGRGTYGGDIQTVEWYLGDNGTIATNMGTIKKILTAQNSTIDSLNTNIKGANAEKVMKSLQEAGIDLEAFGAVSWKYDSSNKFLYWSANDISRLEDGTKIPVMRYNMNTGTYTVWYAQVKTVSNNIGSAGEHTYKTLVDTGNPYAPSTNDKRENQTYEKALDHYNNAVASK